MKFARILRSELVPEWKKKYINYKGLKVLLKSIERPTLESSDTNSSAEVSITIPQPTAAAQQPKRRSTFGLSRHESLISTMSGRFIHSTRKQTSPRSEFRFVCKKSYLKVFTKILHIFLSIV